ncbi:hypothetical protein KIL84_020436 [Mauremys mutica]|uniref:Uncharacterized protein n=1 Tax=Mauremys mutica TaxID=74926 RepID=A0A9D3XX64_9SAUR|nr:hypothetical protein KIL84_020436 [Mauremys mutica]
MSYFFVVVPAYYIVIEINFTLMNMEQSSKPVGDFHIYMAKMCFSMFIFEIHTDLYGELYVIRYQDKRQHILICSQHLCLDEQMIQLTLKLSSNSVSKILMI